MQGNKCFLGLTSSHCLESLPNNIFSEELTIMGVLSTIYYMISAEFVAKTSLGKCGVKTSHDQFEIFVGQNMCLRLPLASSVT